jgi:2-isopropylmalate synthase
VFTAFSGSHQDAIKKGFAARKPQDIWAVPYLPMDPADVGRTYESVVRINSQSGKGGIAFLLERDYGVVLPRKLQIEFSQRVQQAMDASGKELSAAEIWAMFMAEYFRSNEPLGYLSYRSSDLDEGRMAIAVHLNLNHPSRKITLQGNGNGPIDALVNALNSENSVMAEELGNVQVRHYEQRSLGSGSHEKALALIEIATQQGTAYGIGIHANIVTASFHAVISAVNRQLINFTAVNPDHSRRAHDSHLFLGSLSLASGICP